LVVCLIDRYKTKPRPRPRPKARPDQIFLLQTSKPSNHYKPYSFGKVRKLDILKVSTNVIKLVGW
jgi:hypothetical protein